MSAVIRRKVVFAAPVGVHEVRSHEVVRSDALRITDCERRILHRSAHGPPETDYGKSTVLEERRIIL